MIKSSLMCIVVLAVAISCNEKSSAEFTNMCEEYDAVDKQMLDIHEEIKKKYSDDPQFLKRLDGSQLYWIQYRDRHLQALFPKGYDFYRKSYDKTLVNNCKCQELTRLTQSRIEDLKIWINRNKANWEYCPGSLGADQRGI